MNTLPEKFLERLKKIIPSEQWNSVYDPFFKEKVKSFRINTLKKKVSEVHCLLNKRGISFSIIPWISEGIILPDMTKSLIRDFDLVREGVLYQQSLSSMLVPLVLGAQPNEKILDACAGPGSKTSQIAAMMKNKGEITAIEPIKKRYYRLKNVCLSLGATNIKFHLKDARRYHQDFLFDRILVDAPCSSEGRFHFNHKKTYAYWSERKIKEMKRKQKGILLNAYRLLKQGGVLVYSTCTFAPEENEEVIDWILEKQKGAVSVEEAGGADIERYPALQRWKKKTYNEEVRKCSRILPSQFMDGFFIAKLRKG